MIEIKKDSSGKYDPQTIDNLVRYLDLHLASLEYPSGRRVQLAMATFSIALEHQFAIAQLFKLDMHTSAFALIRPLFEATVKGTWLHFCATDSILEKYARGKELQSTKLLLNDLKTSKLPADVFENLSIIQDIGYKVFSSFTHAGFSQIIRWASVDGISEGVSQEEVDEATNTIIILGLITGLECARMSGNQKIIAELSAYIPQ